MCQIYTFVPSQMTAAFASIRSGLLGNRDGVNILVVHETRVVLSLSGVWAKTALVLTECLASDSWTRMFVHLRAATGGNVTTGNCHGWADREKGTRYVMHNGFIGRAGRESFAVDSQAIVAWIEDGDIRGALRKLGAEAFANVFLVDEGRGDYSVHRSSTGTLYTDGNGNYGTAQFAEVNTFVPAYTQIVHALDSGAETSRKTIETPVSKTYTYTAGGYSSGARDWTDGNEAGRGGRYWETGGSGSGGGGGGKKGKRGRGLGAATTTELLPPSPTDVSGAATTTVVAESAASASSTPTTPPTRSAPTVPPILASARAVLFTGTDGEHYADDLLDYGYGGRDTSNLYKRWRHDGNGWVYLGVIDETGTMVRD